MNSVVITKTYSEPTLCEREILRYAGCKTDDDKILLLLRECTGEAAEKLIYKVCYRELKVNIEKDCCDFGYFTLQSQKLAKNLKDCNRVIVFVATVGVELDRLIAKYGRISPSKAVMMQAIGAERIEALCDVFCDDIKREKKIYLRPRFSPGYGDLSLDAQKDIFAVLECSKHIGVTLNDSMLMSPSKSVTAFVGITDRETENINKKCNSCDKKDCIYRGIK